jgi:hypothetical protein
VASPKSSHNPAESASFLGERELIAPDRIPGRGFLRRETRLLIPCATLSVSPAEGASSFFGARSVFETDQ